MRNGAIDQTEQSTNGSRTTTPVPALDRSVALLRILASAATSLTLAELSDAVQVSRSTVYSLLATLQRHGMVEKDPRHKTYQLGVGVFELGSAYLQRVSLVPVFNEVGARLAEQCRETVKLAILDGHDVVYLGKQDGIYSVRLVARVGSRMPAHATAVGKVLLARLEDDTVRMLYEGYQFQARTQHTLRALPDLLDQLAICRRQSFALDREESSIGVQCVAAPIHDHSRTIVAAISIGVPNDRLDDARLAELTTMLVDAAGQISRRLGWTDTLNDEVAHAYS